MITFAVVGAPKARAQALINGLTTEVYKYVKTMMFEQHAKLFTLLLSLERLRMARQLTQRELGLFVNGVDSAGIEEGVIFDDKPEWLSNKVRSSPPYPFYWNSPYGGVKT